MKTHSLAKLTPEELQKHLDGFLIDHWSVSAIQEFIRNEKSFERKYVYRDYEVGRGKSAIIGDVYHNALMEFFNQFKETKEKMGFDQLLAIAHELLDEVPARDWQPEKNKTIEQVKIYALKALNTLIESFLAEFDAYASEIEEILWVEPTFKEFVSINGVEIPLPLKIKIDIVFIDKNGYLCILDHKSKYSYTTEKDITMRYSNQAITYSLGIMPVIMREKEILKKWPKVKEGVKRFLFYENKFTKNRDGSRQIRQIPLDIEKSGLLFEQLLFEGVWKVVQAVQDPDYVYALNPQDIFMKDGDEMIEFWVKTHIEGLEGFPNLQPHQKKILKKRRSTIRKSALSGIPKGMVKAYTNPKEFVSLTLKDMSNLTNEEKIAHRLTSFGYPVNVAHKIEGYSCDTYLLDVAAGQKIGQIYKYRLDIANALGEDDVRMPPSLVRYNDGSYVSIEVKREKQRFLILEDQKMPDGYKFPIGRTNYDELVCWDLGNPSTPHMMIAGATGSGKSVTIMSIIEIAKAKNIPVTILDPKREFAELADQGYTVYHDQEDIEIFMMTKVDEMDQIFKDHGAKGNSNNKQLVIFDEAADCLMRNKGGTLEKSTLLLAQKARSAGIHLLLAAQRFSTKILSGDVKANFPTRLCMMVNKKVDSQVMLDEDGAEKLAGKGDALFTSPETRGETKRVQAFATKKAL